METSFTFNLTRIQLNNFFKSSRTHKQLKHKRCRKTRPYRTTSRSELNSASDCSYEKQPSKVLLCGESWLDSLLLHSYHVRSLLQAKIQVYVLSAHRLSLSLAQVVEFVGQYLLKILTICMCRITLVWCVCFNIIVDVSQFLRFALVCIFRSFFFANWWDGYLDIIDDSPSVNMISNWILMRELIELHLTTFNWDEIERMK